MGAMTVLCLFNGVTVGFIIFLVRRCRLNR